MARVGNCPGVRGPTLVACHPLDGRRSGKIDRMIGRLHHVVIDCADPTTLAQFYSELLGLPVTYRGEGWIVISGNETTSGIAFQQVLDHRAPRWPDPDWPQQFHLDVMVDDQADAARRVLQLGGQRLSGGDNVFADPAGHPFCLIRRPSWASPISE
jgi:catechol 2,3-dioxygenase-like lactoylglutathione lyase family enzyme